MSTFNTELDGILLCDLWNQNNTEKDILVSILMPVCEL